ncbi:MAG: SDR family NAD(P)-dependent oxidoreductase [Immundisolibacter sp.]|uniref:SDR family NAD(P)-dependent oxidoreductase n=1 Tax=Immundisolibacter sp. TaxID=1934948 RepID=UPI003EE0A071
MERQVAPVTLVTGGTYGIGRAITLTLAAQGHTVYACGLEARQVGSIAEAGIAGTAAELAQRQLGADLAEVDVADGAQVRAWVAGVLSRHGRIDALVNNAAIHPRGDVTQTDEALWDHVIGVNLKGVFLTCRAVIPAMRAAGGGAIVNIGSGAGWGKPDLAAYSASKGGVFALSAAMAWDHLDDHIRVNVVVPGGTHSGMTGLGSVPAFERLASRTATGRVTEPRDVANAVAFLLSDAATQISGTVLDVGCFSHQGGRPLLA